MRHRWMLGAIVWIAVLIGLPPVHAETDLVPAAKKEGRVLVYGTLESPIFEVIQALFREKYGIPVEYFRLASNRLLDRVLTEVRAGKPQFDVVRSNLSPMLLMKKEGAFATYTSPSYDAFPSASFDRDGILSPPYRMVVISILYNTRLVPAAEAPKTLTDLLNAKWKGRVVLPDPTQHITTAVWLANLQGVMGPEYRSFVERLAAQAVLVDSFDPAMMKIVAGEYPLGLSYVKYVYIMGTQGASSIMCASIRCSGKPTMRPWVPARPTRTRRGSSSTSSPRGSAFGRSPRRGSSSWPRASFRPSRTRARCTFASCGIWTSSSSSAGEASSGRSSANTEGR